MHPDWLLRGWAALRSGYSMIVIGTDYNRKSVSITCTMSLLKILNCSGPKFGPCVTPDESVYLLDTKTEYSYIDFGQEDFTAAVQQ